MMNWLVYLPYIIIVMLALLSFISKKLTFWGALTAIIVAVCIFWGAGGAGLEMLGAFFVLGVAATGWHKQQKAAFKPAADGGNRRDMWQVLANGGVASVCGLLSYVSLFAGHQQLFCLMMAGSIAAATADTLSSELGMVYGRRFYNVISFKPDTRGLDGVVSLEGTLIGIVGASVIAFIYCLKFGFSANFGCIVLAGAVGNYIDSVLGATLERKRFLNNNLVNFLNTLTGALIALLLSAIL